MNPQERDLAAEYLVKKHARVLGVPESEALSIANQETGYRGLDPASKSPAGALGTMQVMPRTARPFVSGDELNTVEGRIKAGVSEYARLRNKYKDPFKAAVGYHGGEGAIRNPDKSYDRYAHITSGDYARQVTGSEDAGEDLAAQFLARKSTANVPLESRDFQHIASASTRRKWNPTVPSTPSEFQTAFKQRRVEIAATPPTDPTVQYLQSLGPTASQQVSRNRRQQPLTQMSSVTGKPVAPRTQAAQSGIMHGVSPPDPEDVATNIQRMKAAGSDDERQAIAEEIGRARPLTDAESAASGQGFIKGNIVAPLKEMGANILSAGTHLRHDLGLGSSGMTPAERAVEGARLRASVQQNVAGEGIVPELTRGAVKTLPIMIPGVTLPMIAGESAVERYGAGASLPEAVLSGAQTYLGLGVAGRAGEKLAEGLGVTGRMGSTVSRAVPLSTVPPLAHGQAPSMQDVGYGLAFGALGPKAHLVPHGEPVEAPKGQTTTQVSGVGTFVHEPSVSHAEVRAAVREGRTDELLTPSPTASQQGKYNWSDLESDRAGPVATLMGHIENARPENFPFVRATLENALGASRHSQRDRDLPSTRENIRDLRRALARLDEREAEQHRQAALPLRATPEQPEGGKDVGGTRLLEGTPTEAQMAMSEGGSVPSEAPKVEARGKEPWQMTATGPEYAKMGIDEADRAAFGFAADDVKSLPADKLNIKWKDDFDNVKAEQKASGLSPKAWASRIDLSEPIDVVFEDGKFKVDDGYHRYYAARILGKPLNVEVTIKDKPHRAIVERAIAENKPVPADVLADYPDLAAKYGKPTEPTPESADTIRTQIEAMQAGRRPAVELTGQSIRPPVGIKTMRVKGSDWFYDPNQISANDLRKEASDGTIHQRLGYVENKPAEGEPAATVVARTPDSTEAQAAVVSPEAVPVEAEALKSQHPEASVAVEPAEKVIDERQQPVSLEVAPKVEGAKPEWVQRNIDQRNETAERAGVADQIEELSAQGKTARETANIVKEKLNADDLTDTITTVNSVRAKHGIPSMDDRTEFAAWRDARTSRVEARGKEPENRDAYANHWLEKNGIVQRDGQWFAPSETYPFERPISPKEAAVYKQTHLDNYDVLGRGKPTEPTPETKPVVEPQLEELHHSETQPRDKIGHFDGPPEHYTPKAEREAGTRERSLPGTLEEANLPGGKDRTYQAATNQSSLEKAAEHIKTKGLDGAAEWVKAEREPSAEQTATAISVIKGLNDRADAATDSVEADRLRNQSIDVASVLSKRLTEAGQATQAVNVINALSPERALLVAQRMAENAKSRLTPNEAKVIREVTERAQKAEAANSEAQRVIDDLMRRVEGQKQKRSKREKLGNLQIRLKSGADEALAELTRLGYVERSASASTAQLAQLAKYGAFKLAEKGISLADWTAHMVETFGDWIQPHLERIRRDSYALVREGQKQAYLERAKEGPEERRTALRDIREEIQRGIAEEREAKQNAARVRRGDLTQAERDAKTVAQIQRGIADKSLAEDYNQQAREARKKTADMKAVESILAGLERKGQREAAAEAREKAKVATKWDANIKTDAFNARKSTTPTADDLTAIAAERMANSPGLNPNRFYREMSRDYGEVFTKNREVVYREAYQKVKDAREANRQLQTLRTATNGEYGAMTEEQVQAALARRVRTQREHRDARFAQAQEFTRLNWRLKTGKEKALAYAAAGFRAGVLSGAQVVGKIGSALGHRAIRTPVEEAIGTGWRHVFPDVADKAPTQGYGFSTKAEIEALKGYGQGAKEIPELMKTGETELGQQLGKPSHPTIPTKAGTVLAIPGRVHASEKNPLKHAEYNRRITQYNDWAERHGLDPNDSGVRAEGEDLAWDSANEVVLMGDNPFSRALGRVERGWSDSARSISRIFQPVRKVPPNYLIQTVGEYGVGIERGVWRALRARNPDVLESMTHAEADKTMRLLKRGTVGLLYEIAAGTAGAAVFGGYYKRGRKEEEGKPKHGDIKLGPVNISHLFLHDPTDELGRIVATVRREMDDAAKGNRGKSAKDRTSPARAMIGGTFTAGKGLARQLPFWGQGMQAYDAAESSKSAENFLGQMVASWVEPQLIREFGQIIDRQKNGQKTRLPWQGEQVKRSPQTFGERMQEGVPFWREKLSTKQPFQRMN